MAVITVKVIVGDPVKTLTFFDKIKVYRSTTGQAGSYLEITGVGSRISIESTTLVYEYVDAAGDPEYWYKTSYYNSTTGVESSLSEAQQGEGDPALQIITVTELKTNYLFGLDLTDDSGTEYPDSLYEWFIKSAVSWLEHKLDMPLRPKSITDERHDFVKSDYQNYIWLKLREYPAIAVESVQMVLPTEEVVQDFDSSWIHLRKHEGVIHIMPGTPQADTLLFGVRGWWFPFVRAWGDFVPDVFRINYTAGFECGQVPDIFKDAVGKIASFGPLNIAGDLLGGAGIASQSLSIDGLSQTYNTTSSATNAGYGARLLQYSKEVKEVIPTLRRYYKGFGLTVV
jgi:hypothetical protein